MAKYPKEWVDSLGGGIFGNFMAKQSPEYIQKQFDASMKDPNFAAKWGEKSAAATTAANTADQVARDSATAANNAAMPGTRSIQTQVKYDDQGRPIRNDYMSITDKTGALGKQFSLADKIGPDVKLNTQGMDEIRNRAMSTGPSAWANLAAEKQGLEQANAMDQANRGQAGAQTAAFNSLRSRGGMSAGQRERLAMQGAKGAASAQQGVLNQGVLNRQNIMLQDQQSKDQMLMQLPGMDMNAANFAQGQRAFGANAQQFDIGNKLKDVGGLNAYNADGYGKAMQEWGAAKTAEAQRAASSGGGKK